MNSSILAVIIVVLILLLLFAPKYLTQSRDYVEAKLGFDDSITAPVPPPPAKEHMLSTGPASSLPEPVADALYAMGYDGGVPWSETIQATEVDPATFNSQADFVRNTRRFSSGANFTEVADDNNSFAFTNFVGLRRPQHVPIGASARQQQDIDQSVLQRNKDFRFN